MIADLLIELGTEELPPKALKRLSDAFASGIVDGIKKAGFDAADVVSFSTPRRLAVLIKDLPEAQPDRKVERKGPSLQAAFDVDGNPTKAVQGFARSCGVEVDQLEQQETDKGTWLVFNALEPGKNISDLIEDIVSHSITKLPIPKRMRWGSNATEFVRPVHWLVLMHGSVVLDAEILGLKSSNQSRGHRFHANQTIAITQASEYETILKDQAYVIADYTKRRQSIYEQVIKAAETVDGIAVTDDNLLDEVTALNEWPVAVIGEFEEIYLSVPSEALIKTMQDNQKYFPVLDKNNQLKNYFITISNIDSKKKETVKQGNERVIRPRLADAKFFWEQDQKLPLDSYLIGLGNVVFQKKLGTLGEKTDRVVLLAEKIAIDLGADVEQAKRAALLSKCDLMTDMVGEFASLQGVMGKLYALASNEVKEVAAAIDEQYMPRGAGSETAPGMIGQILSISDKMDTLVGIFAIGQKPTGEKDPFALRRASLGILRTIIERNLDIDLFDLIKLSADLLSDKTDAHVVIDDVFDYILERLRAYYLDQGVAAGIFDAVSVLKPGRPLDFDKRIKAVVAFNALPEAESLAAANKRVGNILKKAEVSTDAVVKESLLDEEAEKTLFSELSSLSQSVEPLFIAGEYEKALCKLSSLRKPVDDFFDQVMVMAEDEVIKNNRIALLKQMHALFLHAADLSRLQ